MLENPFIQLGIIILIAILSATVMQLLRQPLIIGYILTGIIISPYGLGIVDSADAITTFAQIGVALLLFMVGLNLNPRTLKDVGPVSLLAGIGQVVFTAVIGFFICRALGFTVTTSLYLATALTFSSTIIIMKLLSDKSDTETLYGRISTGILIVQDIIAIVILLAVSSFTKDISAAPQPIEMLLIGGSALILLFFGSIVLVPSFTKFVARSQEFLLLFSIGWCLAVSSLFYFLHFSMEIGALLGGFFLSFSPYRYEINFKLRPLRDFFIILFFVLLGSQMAFGNIQEYVAAIILLSLFVLLGNPLIVMIIMGLMGYTKRTGFLTGLTVAQISEFSLILIAVGANAGHLSLDMISVVTVIGLITITGSTYLILYADSIYNFMSPYLGIFERKQAFAEKKSGFKGSSKYDIILFGYNRVGYGILESLQKKRYRFLVIDYNPDTVKALKAEGINCWYGDAANAELLSELNLSGVKMVISTVQDIDTDIFLIQKVRTANKDAIIIAVAHQIEESLRLYGEGATYVMMPHYLSGQHAAKMISEYGFEVRKFQKKKNAHLRKLAQKNRNY